MKNALNKTFFRHALTNVARIAAIAAVCVAMSALTLPKPPVAPPTEITLNIDSTDTTDTTDTSDSSDTTQSNFVSACVGDLNQDHAVDSADLGTLLGSFGPCQSGDPGDFNFDSAIDSSDLGNMLGNFGPCPADLAWATVLQWNPDPEVVPDSGVRAKIVASGFPWRVLDKGTGIEMLLIPGGTFTMGCTTTFPSCKSDENPTHQVTLSKAFYLGKTEVTQVQWQAKMGYNPSDFKGYSDSASRPLEQVSWNDINYFNTATGLRLPTEAEWEYAYRGGTTTAFHSMPRYPNGTNDDNLLGNIAWYYYSGSTYAVAGLASNAFGMYDMSGNVYEWCNDWYGSYVGGNATDPAGPLSGSYRVLRGGSWKDDSNYCRSSSRLYGFPDTRRSHIGFRVAKTADFATTVTAISPLTGLTGGGTNITINGTNFSSTSSVTVGGVAATNVNVVSDSVLTAVTPAGSVGAPVSVSVTAPGGTGTLTSAFSYCQVGTLSWATVLEALPNPAVVTDAAVRQKIIDSGYPWRVLDTGTGIEMLLIPDGTFTRGCSASNASYSCSSSEEPAHQVTITKAFYVGKTEVTQAQWQAKMGSNPSYFKSYSDSPSRPVEQVVYGDIASFNTPAGLRLPTEAEWEYACRGGTPTAFHSMPGYPNGTNDESLLGNIAWYSSNSGNTTHAVAGKAANAFGIYDMSGNVGEYCRDFYNSTFYLKSPSKDPISPLDAHFQYINKRGGTFSTSSNNCRSSSRYLVFDSSSSSIGFRVARTPDITPVPTVTAISPASGLTSGGTTITLNGTNFFGASSVTVGGALATSVNVVSATVLTAVTPAGSVGSAVSISVTTPGGTGTLASAFSYYEAGPLSWATVLEQTPNATVVPDGTVRANIVASGHPWRVRDNSSGIEMLLIPSGTFTMGCSASNSYGCYGAENPTHQVTLSNAFYLGKTEVTQAQWQVIMGSNPSYFSGNANHPVEQVSWNDIAGFNTATGLRLPSEAEWEYACRGNTTTAFHSMPGYPNGTNDDNLLENIAWVYPASGSTRAVAGKAANAFGMYDMSGNVNEWCNDWYGSYAAGNATDPAGPSSGSYRVLRGGGWNDVSGYCRSSYRRSSAPGNRNSVIGFRVARTP